MQWHRFSGVGLVPAGKQHRPRTAVGRRLHAVAAALSRACRVGAGWPEWGWCCLLRRLPCANRPVFRGMQRCAVIRAQGWHVVPIAGEINLPTLRVPCVFGSAGPPPSQMLAVASVGATTGGPSHLFSITLADLCRNCGSAECLHGQACRGPSFAGLGEPSAREAHRIGGGQSWNVVWGLSAADRCRNLRRGSGSGGTQHSGRQVRGARVACPWCKNH